MPLPYVIPYLSLFLFLVPLPKTCSQSGPDLDQDLIPDECDNCPYLFNPYQGSQSCFAVEGACAIEVSDDGILWAETLAGSTDQRACPTPFTGDFIVILWLVIQALHVFVSATGTAYRTCNGSGQWEEPNLSSCLSPIGQHLNELVSFAQLFLICM